MKNTTTQSNTKSNNTTDNLSTKIVKASNGLLKSKNDLNNAIQHCLKDNNEKALLLACYEVNNAILLAAAKKNGYEDAKSYLTYLESEGNTKIEAYGYKSLVNGKLEKVTVKASMLLSHLQKGYGMNETGKNMFAPALRNIDRALQNLTKVENESETIFSKIVIKDGLFAIEQVKKEKKTRAPQPPKGEKETANNGENETANESENSSTWQAIAKNAKNLSKEDKKTLIQSLAKDMTFLTAIVNEANKLSLSDLPTASDMQADEKEISDAIESVINH